MRARIIAIATALAISIAGAPAGAAETRFDHHAGRWRRLAHCESTHRWRIRHGGLQIIDSTWRAYTGRRAPARAELASRDFQIRVGRRIAWEGFGRHEPQGPDAWPYCWSRTR